MTLVLLVILPFSLAVVTGLCAMAAVLIEKEETSQPGITRRALVHLAAAALITAAAFRSLRLPA